MKKITEAIIRKEASIHKIQFDKEWFYSVKDMADYLSEDLNGIETVTLPVVIDEVTYTIKCATWDDLLRFLQKEPLEDFRGSVFRKSPLIPKGGIGTGGKKK